MRYRNLPGTSLNISEIGFGVWTVATDWWGVTDMNLRQRLLHEATGEHGINFLDTADTYGDGLGETIIRDTIGSKRDQLVIATKFGYDLADQSGRAGHRERRQNWSASFIQQACERSLKRLGTDYIDLYQMHNPRIDAIYDENVLRCLDGLQQAGKVRYVGVALGPALNLRQIDEAIAAFDRGFKSVQIIYNLLEQQLGPATFTAAQLTGSGTLVRVPHSSGLLEGNLTPKTTFPKWDHRSHRPAGWLAEGLAKVDQLDFLTANRDRTIAQAALEFVLAQPSVTSALPNIYNADQLAEFAASSDASGLNEDDLRQVAARYEANFAEAPTHP